ncbi:MAG: acyl-CoA dehydrogenase [Alphaproteobacteria bacterium]|nr:acyl-CoA dehydrogenase [Alphaproteobacteria bacterium]
MDFTLSPEIETTRRKIAAFVEAFVLPVEADRSQWDEHENISAPALARLRAEARKQGLWALQVPKALGGQGLPIVGMAACYEEMSRSIFGPVVFNSASPDDGNMLLLSRAATPAQQARWLAPVVEGRARSAFVMTEPAPGSGSDPGGMMKTRAEKKGDKWVLNGRKWFITGAEGAETYITVARTSDSERKNMTAFLHGPAGQGNKSGFRVVRRIPIMGPEEHGGHCEVEYDNFEIPDSDRLMGVGEGLKATQIRLGIARLTHCMRWLGMAKRALEIAAPYVKDREAFGQKLAEHEGVQWMLGEAAMAIQTGRLLVMHAAWTLDQGDKAQVEVSMAKIAVADVLHKAVDTAIQLCGAKGYSKDTLLEWMYRYARQARLVDGASEVHKMVLARFYLDRGNGFWRWGR